MITQEAVDLISLWIPPHKRLVVAIVAEENPGILIQRCELVVEGMTFAAGGKWDIVVCDGDFAGTLLDTCVPLEEAVALCDCLDLEYTVEM